MCRKKQFDADTMAESVIFSSFISPWQRRGDGIITLTQRLGASSHPAEKIKMRKSTPVKPGRKSSSKARLTPAAEKDIDQIFRDGRAIDRALNRGIREALLQHKRAGNSVPIWRDGKVVWLTPDQIPV